MNESISHDDDVPLGGDYVEIDWEPLQAALDAMDDLELDLDDTVTVRDHLAVLLASFLRTTRDAERLEDEAVAELAAEVASLAVEIATGDEEVPAFRASDGGA